MPGTRFKDRFQAGEQLAEMLSSYGGRPGLVVLGIARGGLQVAAPVARSLGAPLDVVVIRKLGFPGQPELAMGAIGPGGVRVMNEDLATQLAPFQDVVEETARRERDELERQQLAYRRGRPPAELQDRTVVLVDDGLATGSSMRAAIASVRARRPAWLIVAVPVGSRSSLRGIEREVDSVMSPVSTDAFFSVGQWYQDFSQITDQEVEALLEEFWR